MFVRVCMCVSMCMLIEKKASSTFVDSPDHKCKEHNENYRLPAETEPPEIRPIISAPVATMCLFSVCSLCLLLVLSTPEGRYVSGLILKSFHCLFKTVINGCFIHSSAAHLQIDVVFIIIS